MEITLGRVETRPWVLRLWRLVRYRGEGQPVPNGPSWQWFGGLIFNLRLGRWRLGCGYSRYYGGFFRWTHRFR